MFETSTLLLRADGLSGQKGDLEVSIPSLNWRRGVPLGMAHDEGTPVVFEPESTGLLRIELHASGNLLATSTLAVVPGGELAPSSSLLLSLYAEPPRYLPTGTFEVPVLVVAQQSRGPSVLVPGAVTHDMTVHLEDSHDSSFRRVVTIPRGESTSSATKVPLTISTDRSIVAFHERGPRSNPLDLSWESHGPDLSLRVFPEEEQTCYATPLTPASFTVFYVDGSRRRAVPEVREVVAQHGPGVQITPWPKGDVDNLGAARFEASATSSIRASVGFHEPDIGGHAQATVHFILPNALLFLASSGGIIGVLIARRQSLWRRGILHTCFELLAATMGGFLLYLCVLQGWLPWPPPGPGLVGELPAFSFGLIGGYLGEAVFRRLSKHLDTSSS